MSKSRTIIATESFNSRTPGGVRQLSSLVCPVPGVGFNSRTPGGVRHTPTLSARRVSSFNSRTPGGVRLAQGAMGLFGEEFQFTHPGRGATPSLDIDLITKDVSIHAPREGCDLSRFRCSALHACFNSRTPGGVRLTDINLRRPAA